MASTFAKPVWKNQTATNPPVVSITGILSLLEDVDSNVQHYALKKLEKLVEDHWYEIADYTHVLESLIDDKTFKHSLKCSCLLSKIFFHLGVMDKALDHALSSGSLMGLKENSTYMHAMTTYCIDTYVKLRKQSYDEKDTSVVIDKRLEEIFVDFVERSMEEQKMKEALGLAIEARRLDLIEEVIVHSRCLNDIATYFSEVIAASIENYTFRGEILEKIVDCACRQWKPDFDVIFKLLPLIRDTNLLTKILTFLARGNYHQFCVALQICVDIYICSTQNIVNAVYNNMKKVEAGEWNDFSLKRIQEVPAVGDVQLATNNSPDEETSESALTEEMERQLNVPPVSDETFKKRVKSMIELLEGSPILKIYLKFFVDNIRSDLSVMPALKDIHQNSIYMTAVLVSNSFLNCGTTCDIFLRTNLEFINKASSWNTFIAIASVGVIHKDHFDCGFNIVEPFLQNIAGDPKHAGGAMLALGFIYAGYGVDKLPMIFSFMEKSSDECFLHGSFLAIGLAALGSGIPTVIDRMKGLFFNDSCVAAFSAPIALGLITAGTSNDDANTFISQSLIENQHMMVQRGASIGLALSLYGMMGAADSILEGLVNNTDHMVRMCGAYSIASAYAGTSNDYATKMLWKMAISDANNEVKRAAVSSLGFVLFRSPEILLSILCLFIDSYSPYVRCGVAYALGVTFAGSANVTAVKMVEKLMDDICPFVRQYSYIAAAMISMQESEATFPKSHFIREKIFNACNKRTDDPLSRFGCTIASGLIDAGGRNQTISLINPNGSTRMSSVLGLLIFQNFWYWYPLSLFLSLSFVPTGVIAIDHNLEIANLEITCHGDRRLFLYPESYLPPYKNNSDKSDGTILSMASREAIRAQILLGKLDKSLDSSKKVSQPKSSLNVANLKLVEVLRPSTTSTGPAPFDILAEPNKQLDNSLNQLNSAVADRQGLKPKRRGVHTLPNCRRVPFSQLSYISLESDEYKPIVRMSRGGIIVVEKIEENSDDQTLSDEKQIFDHHDSDQMEIESHPDDKTTTNSEETESTTKSE